MNLSVQPPCQVAEQLYVLAQNALDLLEQPPCHLAEQLYLPARNARNLRAV